MSNEHSSHVVRLSARSARTSSATVLRKHAAPSPTVLLNDASRHHAHGAPHTQHQATPAHARPVRASSPYVLGMLRFLFAPHKHQMLSASLGLTFATGMLGKFATILLIPMLLLQPLLPVYAADESVTEEAAPPVSPPASEETPPVSIPSDAETSLAPTETPTETPASDILPPDGAVTAPAEEVPQPSETPEESADIPVVDVEAAEATTTLDETVTTTDTVVAGEIPDDTVSGGSITDETAHSEEATSTDATNEATATSTELEAVDDTLTDEENTEAEVPTEEVPVVDEAAVRAAEEESARQAEEARQEQIRQTIKKEVVSEFTKGCLTLDGVGYYCLKNFDGSAVGALTPSTAVTGVTSQKDPEGNYKQIFITRGAESIQLTHDAWDNTFPSMDVSGKSVVWQGMAEGRWQIFIADVSGTTTSVVTQLTHGTESNFNPRVDGDSVVWQGWVNGNWEIFLAERLLPAAYYPLRPDTPQDPGGGLPVENRLLGIDNTWHVTRLTTNDTHDMFPSIAGGLVTWQSSQGGSWNVYAYSVKSGVTTKLSQDGTKSENPRFAVTWDEHDANGNARMVGYDIATGKTIDITNEARNTPSGSAPYHPTETPISQPNQAALPPTGVSGTSTPVRADGDDAGGTNPIGT